jgi:hypothetical protein
MSFEELGFLFPGELNLYNSAILFQIVFEARRNAAVVVEPSAHLGHFE